MSHSAYQPVAYATGRDVSPSGLEEIVVLAVKHCLGCEALPRLGRIALAGTQCLGNATVVFDRPAFALADLSPAGGTSISCLGSTIQLFEPQHPGLIQPVP